MYPVSPWNITNGMQCAAFNWEEGPLQNYAAAVSILVTFLLCSEYLLTDAVPRCLFKERWEKGAE
jgi:hypothetical protein